MKLPRDLSGNRLAKLLTQLGYQIRHQTGSHLRLTTQRMGEHHITIPAHDSLRIGTLNAILAEIAAHHRVSRDDLLEELLRK